MRGQSVDCPLIFAFLPLRLPEGNFKLKKYEFDAVIREIKDKGGASVVFPWDVRKEFGKGRVKVHVLFDGIPYDGSIVNMGLKDEQGNVCYIIGLLNAIRRELGKSEGDLVHVLVAER